ncbi:MAG: 4Fe-4S binding protein [Desulfocucumaceae bacterium]
MPPRVDPTKCDGCQRESEPLCEQVCPGNLMTLEKETMKAVIRDMSDCWDCMTCTKACPRQAIQTVLQYQLAYFPGKLIPLVGSNSVTWTAIDCHGRVERFVMKTLVSGDDEDDD